MVKRLNNMDGVTCKTPVGAFYAFPNISAHFGKKFNNYSINNSVELSTYFLEQAKVAMVPGSAFGDDRYIRLSYATSMDNIKKGLDRIEESLSKLQ